MSRTAAITFNAATIAQIAAVNPKGLPDRIVAESQIETTLQPWPICPSCGHEHRDAWEWRLGCGMDGDGEHDCDKCEATFLVSRIVTVDYTTRLKEDLE